MANYELQGVAPQNSAPDTPGVSLTLFERSFLDQMLHAFLTVWTVKRKDYRTTNEESEDDSPRARKKRERAEAKRMAEEVDEGSLTKLVPECRTMRTLYKMGNRIGLSREEVNYIREWIILRGVHWLSCEGVGLGEDMKARLMFRNPLVRKIINAASERGMCVGTTASREEVLDYYTQRMRSTILPEVFKDNAADKLAKMLGYYPKEGSNGGGTVNVQINCVNPYGDTTSAEVLDEN